jgi:hypothetical protein
MEYLDTVLKGIAIFYYVVGKCYVIMGLINYSPEWLERMYIGLWSREYPTSQDFIKLGIVLMVTGLILLTFLSI